MQIIAETEEEQKCIKALLQNLKYAWDTQGCNADAFYKAFEYVNDHPECWKNGELIKDYRPSLEKILGNINKVKVECKTD